MMAEQKEPIIISVSDPGGIERDYVQDVVIPFAGKEFAVLVSIPEDGENVEEPEIILARVDTDKNGEAEYVPPTDEEYAIVTAIRSSLDAFLPICVIEGAINAIIISGMQKLIIWLRIYFSVTTIFNMAFENALPSVELSTSPITTPARTPTISLNGRLFQKLVFFIK